MLCQYGRHPNGRPLIVLGLTGENMTRLMAGEPIRLVLPEQAAGADAPPCVLAIVGGRTEAEIAAQIADSPLAQYLGRPAKPGETIVTEVVDDAVPTWLEDGQAPVEATDAGLHPADAILVLTILDGDRVEVWQREGRTAAEFAGMIRRIADKFETGDVKRVR